MPKINLPSVFIYHTHDDLDSADPSSFTISVANELSQMTLFFISSRSQVDRVPA